MTTKTVTMSILVVILLGGIVAVTEAQATPFYTTRTNYKIIGVVRTVGPDGKSNDCWHEHYLRATPKNNNHVVLNKETIKNNDAPDNGPSETHSFSWYYDFNKMIQTASTNEDRIRLYDTIELTDSITGETVTKYIHADAGTHQIDFGIFTMHVDPSNCKSLIASRTT
jgi:hypothetical protein